MYFTDAKFEKVSLLIILVLYISTFFMLKYDVSTKKFTQDNDVIINQCTGDILIFKKIKPIVNVTTVTTLRSTKSKYKKGI